MRLRDIHSTLFCFFLLMIISQAGKSQNLGVEVTSSTCQVTGQAMPLSEIATITGPDSDILEGIQITITENFESSEDLFTYTFADDIQGSFDANNGIFTLSGQSTIANYRKALERLYFSSTTADFAQKTINITLSGVDFLVETGHFYQFFPSAGISWSDARDQATQKELFGLEGYLTTITSSVENQFILDRVSGTAWIGASDEQQEGIWKWVTGPENGTVFWEGLADGIARGYSNWQPVGSSNPTGEPNQSGDEDYAHMMSWTTPSGQWNDLPNAGGGGQYSPTGYIVEYGGQLGDPDILSQISGSSQIDWQREIELTGATSVCPNIEGVTYNATALDAHTYDWTVFGGTIVSGKGTDQIVVNWGNTNANAKVMVNVTSDLACTYSEELDVIINKQLEPPLPVGNSFVCFTDINTRQTYSTPFTPDSEYIWKVTNGTVVSGQETNEVQILWNGPGTGTLYFTESTETDSDYCDGDSPLLTVDLREEIIPEFTIEHVKCFGGNDGSARLEILSPGNNISYDWIVPSSATINGNEVSDLMEGSYSVLVSVDGCQVEFPFEITEPDVLEGYTEPANVLCFGESNGTAEAIATGGTGAYRYTWSHDPSADGAFVNNLPAGDHSVEILDDNNCQLVLNFTITEPELLVIDEIISTLVSCPEGSDGTLEAIISGGTQPYSYEWEFSTDTESLATGFPKGEYRVIVTDANGCQTQGSQIIEEAIPKVVLPNAFSPNSDGMNDTFGPNTPCDITFKMEIYSRWGEIIFSTKSSLDHWDGYYKGQKMPLGSYTYVASWVIVANDLEIKESKRGEIQLIN